MRFNRIALCTKAHMRKTLSLASKQRIEHETALNRLLSAGHRLYPFPHSEWKSCSDLLQKEFSDVARPNVRLIIRFAGNVSQAK